MVGGGMSEVILVLSLRLNLNNAKGNYLTLCRRVGKSVHKLSWAGQSLSKDVLK